MELNLQVSRSELLVVNHGDRLAGFALRRSPLVTLYFHPDCAGLLRDLASELDAIAVNGLPVDPRRI